jgi:hypothetical protein
MFKSNIKYKILSKVKDKLIFHLGEKEKYLLKEEEWNKASYFDMKNLQCYNQSSFDKMKERQIKWSHEQWLLHYYKCELLSEIIKEIEEL